MGRVSSVLLRDCIFKLNSNIANREEYLNNLANIAKYIDPKEPLIPQARSMSSLGLSLRYFLIVIYKNFNITSEMKEDINKLKKLEYSLANKVKRLDCKKDCYELS